jgi:hypothetical protein
MIENLLPTWVQPAIYIFLGLMALEVVLTLARILVTRKQNRKLAEISAKVNLVFLMAKSWNEDPVYHEDFLHTEEFEAIRD